MGRKPVRTGKRPVRNRKDRTKPHIARQLQNLENMMDVNARLADGRTWRDFPEYTSKFEYFKATCGTSVKAPSLKEISWWCRADVCRRFTDTQIKIEKQKHARKLARYTRTGIWE